MAEEPQVPANVVRGFKGLNNRLDPTALGLEWQLEAENVLCDDAGYLLRRPGIQDFLTGFKDIHGARDGRLLGITTSDELVEIKSDGNMAVLATGVVGAPFSWTELGYAIFIMSPTHAWAIYPHRVIQWGSLCPSAPTDTYPIGDPISYPPPFGSVITTRRSQLVVGVWEPERDRSVLYFSRSDFPHEFRLDRDYLLIPGRITLLASLAQGLVIGTDRAIYLDPIDTPLQRVADYGVPLGALAYDDRNLSYFWSDRGLCRAFPFENLTDAALVVTPHAKVTAGVFPWQGSTYVIVARGGAASSRTITQPYTLIPITSINSSIGINIEIPAFTFSATAH